MFILRCKALGVQSKEESKYKMFELHKTLKNDCLVVGEFTLSLVLLSRDANYPWLILVPQRPNITEIFQLQSTDRQQLLRESCNLSEAMMALFAPDKLNIATLGNLVPQLHMHHVARYASDPAWPAPVWGAVPSRPYNPEELSQRCQRLRQYLHNYGLVCPEH